MIFLIDLKHFFIPHRTSNYPKLMNFKINRQAGEIANNLTLAPYHLSFGMDQS